MYNLKKVRGKVVHKIIQEIVHNSIVSQKPMKLSIIYIRFYSACGSKSALCGFMKSKNRTICAKLKMLHPQLSGLEHLSSEQRVVGSNPSGCTILSGGSRFLCVMEKNNLILQTKLLKSGTISTSRAGSSAGQSTSLLSLVSWVQVPPGSPTGKPVKNQILDAKTKR